MTLETTPRLSLPLLASGQAQKELVHNEALAQLDVLVGAAVETVQPTPPALPSVGQCWIVGAAPTGAWVGRSGSVACWTANGWRFAPPREGLRALVTSSGLWADHVGGVWATGVLRATELRVGGQQVIGSRQPAIGDPSGGSVADAEARAAIGAILTAMRAHGLIAS